MDANQKTRGERNNNPGNIVRDGDMWHGMATDQSGDSRFIVFISPDFGIRAIGKIVNSYYYKHGLTTVESIINRWAPPVENNTNAYICDVADKCGVKPDEKFPLTTDNLSHIVKAIIIHENGRSIYTDGFITDSITL